jgi:hypothetical protein
MSTKVRDLLTFFESYYGEKYTGIFLDSMVGYLSSYSDDFLESAGPVIVKRYSRTFNKSPGIEEFEANMGEIIQSMPRKKELPGPEISEEQVKSNLAFISSMKAKLAAKVVV